MKQNNFRSTEQHKIRRGGIGISGEVEYNVFLSSTEKRLFGHLQNLSRRSGYCWASNEYLGKAVGVGPQSISNSLKNLKIYCYINIDLTSSGKRTSRIISINPKYKIMYKPLVKTFFDNVNELKADQLLKLLSDTIKSILDDYNKF